jgi:hypothetical protein
LTRTVRAAFALSAVLAVAGCQPRTDTGAGPEPPVATPCSRVSTPPGEASQSPTRTELAWRAEHLRDGSIRMTIGDIGAAPKDPNAVETTDYRAPDNPSDCYQVRIMRVYGWWCATTVSPIAETGEIVIGGGAPRAHIHSAGFRTRCSGRTEPMRQSYQIQRDSWTGWRSYADWGYTPWTTRQDQSAGTVSALCPRGRVGTYNYRLAVAVEFQGLRVDPTSAASARIRTDCGTGVS